MNRKVQKWWYFPDNRLNIFVTVIPDPEGLQWTIRKRGRLKRRDGRCFLLTIPEHPFYRKRNVFLRSGISQFSLFEDHKGPLRPAARFFLSSRRVEALLLVRHAISDEPRPSSGTFYYSVDTWPAITSAPFHTHTHVDTVTVDFVTGKGSRSFAALTIIDDFSESIQRDRNSLYLLADFIYLRRCYQMLNFPQ